MFEDIYVYRLWDKHEREVMDYYEKLGNNFIHIGYEHFIEEKEWDKLESEGNLQDFLNNYPYQHNPEWKVIPLSAVMPCA